MLDSYHDDWTCNGDYTIHKLYTLIENHEIVLYRLVILVKEFTCTIM